MRSIMWVLVLGLAALACGTESAKATEPMRIAFVIEAQPVRAALHEFARQSGMQLLHRDEDVRLDGAFSPRVEGNFSVTEALDCLLSNTEFRYEFINARTVRLVVPSTETRTAFSDVDVVGVQNVQWVQRRVSAEAPVTEGDSSVSASESKRTLEEARNRPDLDQVVVTAQRRSERLIDVPISISVLDGADLDGATAQGASEMLSRVPGVAIEEAVQGGTTQITVRGVSAAWGVNTGSSPIGYYLDAVPFGFVRSATTPDPDVYDLSQIEILRGPQGTLYGASSVNGVVRVLTNDPNLEKLEVKGRGLTSNTRGGDWNYRGDMAINVPIVDGKLGARAVLGYQRLDGWIDRPDARNANDAERRNARLKISAKPTDQLSIGLSAWVSHDDFGAPSVSDDQEQYSVPNTEQVSTDFETYGFKVGYDFSAFSLTSSTSYIDYLNDGKAAINFTTGAGLRTVMSAKTFSEEVNVASKGTGPWRWTAGAIYRDGQDRRFQANDSVVPTLAQSIKFISKSWAVFGELTRSFFDDRLEFTAGLRHFEDDVGVREELRFAVVQPSQYVNRDTSFHSTTPRFVLAWKPYDQMTAYASYAEGFRSGAEQLPAVLAAVPSLPPAKPDLLKNYELGLKSNFWDGGFGIDMAVYYFDWHDVQLPLVVLVDNIQRSALLNGQSASGLGADLSLIARPLRGLELGVSYSWNDLEMDSDAFLGTLVAFSKGDRLNASPPYTIGASLDYSFQVGAGFGGHFSASANRTARRNFRTLVGPSVVALSGEPITVGRVSLGVDSVNRWSAMLFVDNINNERGAVSRAFTGPAAGMRIRPRTMGVQLEYRY